jgi:ABC-type uncharacterized transport system involved in gliding motility auxiliary subunit
MRRTLADLLHALLLLAAVGVAAWLSLAFAWRVDLSHGLRASLSPQSVQVLRQFEGPVEIVSYARENPQLRETLGAFIGRYRQVKPDLSLHFVNPDADPGAMRERGITVDGELEIHYAGRTQRLAQLDERALTSALARLVQPRERLLAVLAGHGERRIDGEANHDLGRFGVALAEQGVRALPVNLAEQAAIPANADVLLVASPRAALAAGEIAAVVAWVEQGGALWWLTDAGGDTLFEALVPQLGVRPLPGTLVDSAAQGLGIGDPSFVAVTRYPPHPVTEGFALTTLYPQAAALAVGSGATFKATPIVRSGERSWTESGAVADAIRYDTDSTEVPGPHDLALALTRLSPRPDRSEQRVVVMGDGDFLADAYLGNGGNLALGLRIFDWLAGDDALVDTAPVEAPDRALALDPRQLGWLGAVFLVGLPLLFALVGAVLAWRRRRA